MSKIYNHGEIELKWRKKWIEENIYTPSIKESARPFYNLMMFPYPSAEGLHVGNMYAFTGADVYGRFMRMSGYDVFEPIGLDGFGIHSENYAIKIGQHPAVQAEISQERFYEQLSRIGNSYAWDYRLETYNPGYYQWTQWLFIQMFKHGLAYRKSASVNWCPSCKTVLADEQVENGACERCQSTVERREMKQWFFRITQYAQRLLDNIDGSRAVGQTSALAQTEKQNHDLEDDSKAVEPDISFSTPFGSIPATYDPSVQGLFWPEKIKSAQKNWIGRKVGARVEFSVSLKQAQSERGDLSTKVTEAIVLDPVDFASSVSVFTTRLDTIFGVTFLVIAPELGKTWIESGWQANKEVTEYINNALNRSEQNRKETEKEKSGAVTDLEALNPISGEKVPIFVADYVLMDYGTGAVMGVPAHDQRDLEFAQKFNLPVKTVIEARDQNTQSNYSKAELINSGKYTGLSISEAPAAILTDLQEKGLGQGEVNYHLRDWLISRQRYWGPPIPMYFCPDCAREGRNWFNSSNGAAKQIYSSNLTRVGESSSSNLPPSQNNLKSPVDDDMAGWFPAEEAELPVKLPDLDDFKPSGDGSSPLEKASDEWLYLQCRVCKGRAKRETDVSDTFLDSSWYFLAYPNLHAPEYQQINNSPFNPAITKKWLPVNSYIGGAEHAVLHLLYSRFVTMCLKDWGYLDFEEPFPFLYSHGLIVKDGAKMSKSRGNVVVPDKYIEKYGSDTLRMYLMFLGPYDAGGDFRDSGIAGMHRFLIRFWEIFYAQSQTRPGSADKTEALLYIGGKTSASLQSALHKTIKKMRSDLGNFKYNTAIAALMEFINLWRGKGRDKNGKISLEDALLVCRLIAPLAPFMAEDIYQDLKKLQKSSGEAKNDSQKTEPCCGQNCSCREEAFGSVHTELYPESDESKITKELQPVVIQINGKTRLVIDLPAELIEQEEVVEYVCQIDSLSQWIKFPLKKVIWIAPNSSKQGLLNLVF